MAKKISDLPEKAILDQDGSDLFETEQISPNASFKTSSSAILSRAKRDATVIVNSIDDFPDPVAGVITLAANTEYKCSGTFLFSSDRIVVSAGTVINGGSLAQTTLIYTGTSPFISGTNVGLDLFSVTISSANAIPLSFDSTAVAGNVVRLVDLLFIAGIGIGSFTSLAGVLVDQCTFLGITGAVGGISLLGTITAMAVEQCLFGTSTFTGAWIDFGTSTITSTVNLTTNVLVIDTAQFGISGLVDTGNFTTGLLTVFITDFDTSGGGTALENITQNDNSALFFANTNINDSSVLGSMRIDSNATETSITTIDVPVKAAGTFITGPLARFSFASNTLTYTGGRTLENLTITTSSTLTVVANNQTIATAVFQNGNEVAGTRARTTLNIGDSARVTSIWVTTAEPNDTFELFVVNESGTTNLTVVDNTFLITD